MAVIDDELFKLLKGRVGNCVVYRSRGQVCLRRCPEDFRPTGAGQVAQQKRIRSVATFYRVVRKYGLADSWRRARKCPGWTGYNLFVKRNLEAFSASGLMEAPEKVCLTAETGLGLPDGLALECAGKGKWRVTWREERKRQADREDDRMVVAVMRCGRYFDVRFPGGADGSACRREEGMEVVLPEKWSDYVHVFCFVRSADGQEFSASSYLGILC